MQTTPLPKLGVTENAMDPVIASVHFRTAPADRGSGNFR